MRIGAHQALIMLPSCIFLGVSCSLVCQLHVLTACSAGQLVYGFGYAIVATVPQSSQLGCRGRGKQDDCFDGDLRSFFDLVLVAMSLLDIVVVRCSKAKELWVCPLLLACLCCQPTSPLPCHKEPWVPAQMVSTR